MGMRRGDIDDNGDMGGIGDRWLGAAMFVPALLYIACLVGVPLILAFLYSVGNVTVGSIGYRFVGLANFRSVLQNPAFRGALLHSFIFTICAQLIVIVGANILAMALRNPFRGRGVVRFLTLLPWVAPISLGAIGWKWILDSIYSVINWGLVHAHLVKPFDTPMWLGEPKLAMGSVILVHAWRMLPFSTVILLAGTMNLTRIVEEQARAAYGDLVFHTTIPLNTRLAEAPAAGQPITVYAPNSPGGLAYAALAAEIEERYGR